MNIAGRHAVVTGASSGIGEATARALADEGCSVALVARRESRLEALAEEIDGETVVVPTDVTDEEAVTAMAEEVESAFGGVDLLVNNAGVARGGPVAETELDELRPSIRVNLEGVMNVTHALLPSLLDAELGDVITVSSLSARYPQEGGSSYTASKFGVNGFMRSLRKEMSDEEVRVTIVMPGPVVTELNDWEHWEGRAMDPEDVAETIAFTASRPRRVELAEVSIDSTDKL
ncbi:NADP-dependent 3-hydroxy acid dehydrogenase YdfG [Halovenus aranensis]|jgi:NADP-dependent 3-hydroxy acid dehydrogenase YdfG|uniref:NADP-dependent 3-hydroxy acid dehydrogenase YdfG n=1 Tax=Halovenus aranensis TaxID=890420 RepID=A0A1G8T2K7_9EURY|nr:SDR family oxidoreductase [Halovenus aranensis]SDJ34900.1 NADP-dependent 3-hydroxy acid dehydrogenase YdfG [Halovenus aranensis]